MIIDRYILPLKIAKHFFSLLTLVRYFVYLVSTQFFSKFITIHHLDMTIMLKLVQIPESFGALIR